MGTAGLSRKLRWSAQEHRHEWNAATAKSRLSRRRFEPAIPISLGYAWRYPTGPRNCGSFSARHGCMKMRDRIERLEEAILPLPSEPPEVMHVQFVDADKRVVDTRTFEMAPVREWRTAQRRAAGGSR